jgi:hypothetical protein
MDIEITEQKFRKYFKPQELVSILHYNEFVDKDTIYALFTPELKGVVVHIRESVGLPMTINNWHTYGAFQYRGYRDKTCSIGAVKSAHREGEAIDFDFRGITAERGRELIVQKAMKELPYPIRIEEGVNWIHIDTRRVFTNDHKINYFRP